MESAGDKRLCELIGVFSSPIRRAIIRFLATGSPRSFTSILNQLKSIDPTIKSNNLSYHLRELAGLIVQGTSGAYKITPRGMYIKEVLDDLEAAARAEVTDQTEMDRLTESRGAKWESVKSKAEAEKVVIGGLLIRIGPADFVRLAKESGSQAVHGRIGTFRPKEFYLASVRGLTYYCKSDVPLEGLRTVEASRLEIPKNIIVDI